MRADTHTVGENLEAEKTREMRRRVTTNFSFLFEEGERERETGLGN